MKWTRLIISILICQLAGLVGTVFITGVPEFYAILQKPFFAPPGWLFGPVWIILYTLMGISLYLVWEKGLNRKALYVFSIQLILNALWSFLFFGLQNPLYGLIDITALWFAIGLTVCYFYKISKKAGLLLIPYFVWVGLAFILNYYIWILNT